MEPLRVFFENLSLEWDLLQPLNRDDIPDHLLESFAQETNGFAWILDVGTGIGGIVPIFKRHYSDITLTSVKYLRILFL